MSAAAVSRSAATAPGHPRLTCGRPCGRRAAGPAPVRASLRAMLHRPEAHRDCTCTWHRPDATPDGLGARSARPASGPAGGSTCGAARSAATSAAATARRRSTPRAHFAETGHPVVPSFEPGEDWFWDYLGASLRRRPGLAPTAAPPLLAADPRSAGQGAAWTGSRSCTGDGTTSPRYSWLVDVSPTRGAPMTTALRPSVDVRRAADRFASQHRLAGLQALLLLRPPLRPGQHPPRPAAGQQRRHRRRRAPASRPTRTATWRSSPGCWRARSCTRTPTGHNGVIYPGLAQRMSAGTRHPALARRTTPGASTGERHRDPSTSCRCGCLPDESGITPGYEQLDIDAELLAGGLVPVASGMAQHDGAPPSASATGTPPCTPPGCSPARRVALPDAPFVHLFVPARRGHPRGRRPARHRRRRPAHRHRRPAVTADRPAEVLVWEMHAGLSA